MKLEPFTRHYETSQSGFSPTQNDFMHQPDSEAEETIRADFYEAVREEKDNFEEISLE